MVYDVDEEFDTQYQDSIVCPYCGYKDRDSWECSEDASEWSCGCCDKEFNVSVYTSVSYTTHKKKD